ncbi:methyltransferase domain-containing protein [Streptodolium elevatio]|uniref:Methyltransferase domain-containing protein n=1 Tax=Streptodolium elevatio TaxID=3157996 RepID=A0ABV3DPB3_9ACTN
MSKHPATDTDTKSATATVSGAATDTTAADSTALIALLDAVEAAPGAAELRGRSYDLLRTPTAVADVGCGAGRAVAELRDRGFRATGVDPDPTMLATARSRFPEGDFRSGDAYALPFRDGELTGYRADKVFHELDDPARALAEATRVLAPGGRIVLIGQDWDTVVVDSDDAALTRAIVHGRADLVTSPRAARGYRNLLLDAGCTDVAVEVHTPVLTDGFALALLEGIARATADAGLVPTRSAESWVAEQRERAQHGRLFVAVPMFLAAATAPNRTRADA